jgi:hypothetical protein
VLIAPADTAPRRRSLASALIAVAALGCLYIVVPQLTGADRTWRRGRREATTGTADSRPGMPPRHLRRGGAVLALAVVFAALAGCGSTSQRDAAAGTPIEVDGISYQVQLSRELNPDSGSDHPFFAGVPAAGRHLPSDQIWLGVFLQGQNQSHELRRTAVAITVADAFNHDFRPVGVAPGNDYAYRPETLAPGDAEPSPDSPAADAPEQGSLLLFHLPVEYFLADRPLELRIAEHGQLASVQLDV